jgi:signal peptidase I
LPEVKFLSEISPEITAQPATGAATTSWKRFFFDILETLLLSALLFVVINILTARVRVDGFSMLPTLKNNELALVNRLAYRFSKPERGDIIVFHFPVNPKEDLIKRVIGLPGEEVVVTDGRVYINGTALEEPYIASAPAYTSKWSIPEGYLFVLGDNRNDSADSHTWGMLPLDNVVGKAVLVYWPITDWMILKHEQPVLAAP